LRVTNHWATLKLLITLLLPTILLVWACGAGSDETPIEEAEEEAGLEEVASEETTAPEETTAEPTTSGEIQAQWMNMSDEEKAREKTKNMAKAEEKQRREAESLIRLYEETGQSGIEEIQCLQAKMLLDRGKEATDEFLEAETTARGERIKSEMTMGKEEKDKSKAGSPTLIERFAEEGYECERGTPPSNAEKGRDEGGQDISNIPDLPPGRAAEAGALPERVPEGPG
jgi:hypothetical protein